MYMLRGCRNAANQRNDLSNKAYKGGAETLHFSQWEKAFERDNWYNNFSVRILDRSEYFELKLPQDLTERSSL